MVNRYSESLEYSVYSHSHLNFQFKGKIKIIAITKTLALSISLELHFLTKFNTIGCSLFLLELQLMAIFTAMAGSTRVFGAGFDEVSAR